MTQSSVLIKVYIWPLNSTNISLLGYLSVTQGNFSWVVIRSRVFTFDLPANIDFWNLYNFILAGESVCL
jgi:hypothetical protein